MSSILAYTFLVLSALALGLALAALHKSLRVLLAGSVGHRPGVGSRQGAARRQRICPACGESKDADAEHCDSCGARLSDKPCPRCGKGNRGAAAFCSQCGAELAAITALLLAFSTVAVADDSGDPHAGLLSGHAHSHPTRATAQPSSAVPAGSVRVLVMDGQQRPAQGAQVILTELKPDGDRETSSLTTGAQGVCVFSEQPTGGAQAYRVSVPYRGARYDSPPFRLPADTGYSVIIHRLETTADESNLVAAAAQIAVALSQGRVAVDQRFRLVNLGQATYVFPRGGLRVELPEGHSELQVFQTAGDQRVTAVDEGMAIFGSVPQGVVNLSWRYQLAASGTSVAFSAPVPWQTSGLRVVAEAGPSVDLQVEGMPRARIVQQDGVRLLVTEMQLGPGDPRRRSVRVTLGGLPGPGPLRWLALLMSLIILAVGATAALRGPRRPSSAPHK